MIVKFATVLLIVIYHNSLCRHQGETQVAFRIALQIAGQHTVIRLSAGHEQFVHGFVIVLQLEVEHLNLEFFLPPLLECDECDGENQEYSHHTEIQFFTYWQSMHRNNIQSLGALQYTWQTALSFCAAWLC